MALTPHSPDRLRPFLRSGLLLLLAFMLAYALYQSLSFEVTVKKGLCLLTFIGLLWLTEALPLAATALLVPTAALLLGFPGMTGSVALAPFVDPIVFLFLGGFTLATALRMQQLDRKMAMAVLALSRGHLGRAALLLFAVTALLSMGISNTATTAMLLPLATGLLSTLDPGRDRRTFAFVLLGVAYAASIGGMGTIVGSAPNAIAARAAGMHFADWLWIGPPLVLVLLPLMVLTLWLVLRPRLHRQVSIDMGEVPWTPRRRLTVLVFAMTALGWMVGGPPLKALGIQSPDTFFALLATMAVLVLGLASWRQVMRHTDWGVLILFGGGLALSEVLATSGAAQVLGQQVAQALQDSQPWLVLLSIAAFMVLISEFASNTAAAALLVPVFAAIAGQIGLPRETLVVLVALAASCGFALPVATPPNTLVYGTGQLRQSDMLRAGAGLDGVCILVLTAWGLLTLWR